MKKQLLIFTLAMSLSVPLHSVEFNVEDFKTRGSELKDKAAKLLPIVQDVVQFIKNGDIDGLETYLQRNMATLNLAPTLTIVQNNISAFKAIVEQVLNNFDIVYQIPGESRATIQKSLDTVRQNLTEWDTIKSNLSKVIPLINISDNITFIAAGLRSIATSDQFKALQPALENYFNTTVKPSFDVLAAVDFSKIAQAMDEINKKLKGQQFNLLTVIAGVGQARKAAPIFVGFIESNIPVALKINDALVSAGATEKMSSQLQNNLSTLQSGVAQVRKVLDTFNTEISKALTQ